MRITKSISLVAVLLISCISAASALHGADLSSTAAYVELSCAARGVEAFHDDIMIIVGSEQHTGEVRRQVLRDGLARISLIESHLAELSFGPDEEPLAEALTGSLDALDSFYRELLDAPDDSRLMPERFNAFRLAYQRFGQGLLRAFPDHVARFSPRGEWMFLDADAETEALLAAAQTAWEFGRAQEAYDSFKALTERPNPGAWRFFAMMKMADCLLHEESLKQLSIPEENARPAGYELLQRVVDAGQYSPVLSGAYLRWRAAHQVLKIEGGADVGASIPNPLYNRVRRKVMLTLVREIERDPTNYWARHQLYTLADAPNLNRSGGRYNTGYHEYTFFFGKVADAEASVEKSSAVEPQSVNVAGALMKAELDRWQRVLEKWSDDEQREKLAELTVDHGLIEKIHRNIQSIGVTPPVPGEYETYAIPDSEKALQQNLKLGKLVHNLIESRTAEELGPYRDVLYLFRELLVMDCVHIPYVIRNDDSRADFWHLLHSQLLGQIKLAMKTLPTE